MNKKILSAIVSLSLIAAIIVSCGIFNVLRITALLRLTLPLQTAIRRCTPEPR